MRGVQRALIALYVLLPLSAYAADEKLKIDLNSVEILGEPLPHELRRRE